MCTGEKKAFRKGKFPETTTTPLAVLRRLLDCSFWNPLSVFFLPPLPCVVADGLRLLVVEVLVVELAEALLAAEDLAHPEQHPGGDTARRRRPMRTARVQAVARAVHAAAVALHAAAAVARARAHGGRVRLVRDGLEKGAEETKRLKMGDRKLR